ncbi:MAG: 2,4-dihydroxyhept-2-ene-1,7-dioic acid aldolase [Geminicoccaceae bacterium]|nr:MAG: 2,4-dihydroxyhept-2-ene-1,7-dioic acid aldolase [Geminicoccaceae bacterium]
MRANALRTAWQRGEKTINGWCSMPTSFGAEVMAHAGWDSLTIDMQHGLVDYQAAVTMLQAISTTDVTPMVRVPWLEAGVIMKVLDAGAYGVICPMINTAEDAERLVRWCSYPPRGDRSFGPIRALVYGGADYPENANATILKIAMIETVQAVENLDAILAVEGLDGVYVGPSDLANSMGHPPRLDPTVPAVIEACQDICRKAKAKGLYTGMHTGDPTYTAKVLSWGFDFATIASDSRLMQAKAQEVLQIARSGTAAKAEMSSY